MGIGLYTSRVLLNTLGVEDFGVYSVVGGVVASFGFLSATLSSASSRFLSFAIGQKDFNYLRETFSATNTINFIAAVVILILCELVGIWWLNNKAVIPDEKLFLAHVLLQLSIASAVISLLFSAFVGLIVSFEKMNTYAISQLIQTLCKLLVVLMLPIVSTNSVITYAVLLLVINVLFSGYYVWYCFKYLDGVTFNLSFSKSLKKITLYSSWDLFGNLSVVARTEGVSLLQNTFFGVTISTAIGIANQVQGAFAMFASNILFAVRPQVVKSFSEGKYGYMNDMIFLTTKYSTLLLSVVLVPMFIELDYIIYLWLAIVPEYVLVIVKWLLLFVVIANVSSCVMMGIHATGKIAESSLINGTLYLLVLPVSYLIFRCYKSPEIPYVINCCFVAIGANLNMYYLRRKVRTFSIKKMYQKVLFPVSVLGLSNYFLLKMIQGEVDFLSDLWRLVVVCLISIVYSLGVAWVLLFEDNIKTYIKRKICKERKV